MSGRLLWLADVLRAAGCSVVETVGWKERGRGDMGTVRGILAHHTGPGSKAGLLNLITDGRKDLAGPLSQLFLDEDGTWYVIAAGRCNHAGAGSWQGVTSGNSSFIGVEARNAGDGKDVWENVQIDAYALGCAAILMKLGEDAVMVAGHKEYALPRGRKIDPSFDMVAFREQVQASMHLLAGGKGHEWFTKVETVDPARSMLRKGDQGNSVRELQRLLKITVDGGFGPKTERAVIDFQKANGLAADGRVGPQTWAKLLG